MNKLLGFLELKEIGIPAVRWSEFIIDQTILSDELLWTLRTAIYSGNDMNLPRAIGIMAEEANNFAKSVMSKYNNQAMVIYYPYFIAIKSGTLEIKKDGFIIEAVKDDLWNLVTNGERDITIICNDIEESKTFHGNEDFLTDMEFSTILENINIIRRKFYKSLSEGKSALLEWSFAMNTDIDKKGIGEPYLVFYECRLI